ncbi:DUF4269 domain-containing protein [Fluviicola taffensis]|uniref:DUF4269 domain-containing protein n=1 Tax=Fluviicola taffensis (strain DSM 16823 / NCIMB 13979 / RW262) TaxID=755732 RepID=F2IA54_FLUTR|nr:DUF4269 domain-containing protein [Fluviicola taffensis]AEA45231.1 hypothetical protein Fluta_3258 [Fluviicola taffensis DSM 16823]
MIRDFENIDYLKSGNARQRSAYEILTKYEIITLLKAFNPILVGTIPINIDLETSDLDIICKYSDKNSFIELMKGLFGNKEGFLVGKRSEYDAIVCHFWLDGFEIEIFAQDIPTKHQNGYRHMLIEYKLLVEKGESFRLKIIELKKQGHKTEPAFGIALELKGDPYKELVELFLMDERRQLILAELKKQCEEKQIYEFDYYWEIWGVMWYPWFMEFYSGASLSFTANDISSEDLNYFVETGELELIKVYERHEMIDEFDRVRFRLKTRI